MIQNIFLFYTMLDTDIRHQEVDLHIGLGKALLLHKIYEILTALQQHSRKLPKA